MEKKDKKVYEVKEAPKNVGKILGIVAGAIILIIFCICLIERMRRKDETQQQEDNKENKDKK